MPAKSIESRVDDLLAQMTLKEKVGQVNQTMYGWNAFRRKGEDFELTQAFTDEVAKYGGIGALYGLFRADPWSAVTFETGIGAAHSAKVANMIQRHIHENTRLAIPVLLSEECPHGHMAIDGTLLPTNIAVGSTWNPALYQKAASYVAREIRARGAHLGLVSTLDLARDPRWGRTEECFSEDPYLASQMAHAAITGLQGEARSRVGTQNGVAAVAKHLAAQGAGEGGRNAASALIGERELYELYLPQVQAAVEAQTIACMAAYNEIDGIPCHANAKLLTRLLRDRLGFDGFVMADGCALDRLVMLAGDHLRAAALGLRAGVDLSLWDHTFTTLEEAVEQALVPVALLDQAVKRVLRVKFMLGLFDQPYVDKDRWKTSVAFPEINDASLQLAREAVVLLKNEASLLPLQTSVSKIAVIGPNADSIYNQLGDYTSPQRPGVGTTVLKGLRQLAGLGTTVSYAKGCGIRDLSREGFAEAIELAKRSDVVVLVLGGCSTRDFSVQFDSNGAAIPGPVITEMDCGEGVDIADLELGGVQMELAEALAATGKPIIAVLIQGRPHAVERLSKITGALLCAWYPGPHGGQAIAEILLGKLSPSGRLPVTIPRSSGQLPVCYNLKDFGPGVTYLDEKSGALYPFGFGLSYSRFEYGDLMVNNDKHNTLEVSVIVRNAGSMAAAEVVQLYLKDHESSVTRRVKELKGLDKVFLQPSESKTVRFTLAGKELGVWNAEMNFVIERGSISIMVGGDSASPAFTTRLRLE